MNSMIVKLTEINKRYVELNDLLVSDEIISKPKEIAKLAKEQASLKQAVDAYEQY